MKLQFFITAMLLHVATLISETPHSIVLTFEPYPTYQAADDIAKQHEISSVVNPKKKIANEKTKPKAKKKQAKKTIKVAGIPIFYYGSFSYSPQNGIVMFNRMHENPQFYILVCAEKNKTPLEPIFMVKNTIHHFKVSPTASYEFFLVTKKYDETTKTYFWHVEKKPLPTDQQLPIETLVIFAYPSDIYLPEGISLTNDNAQAILPVIYVKHDHHQTENALAAIEVSYLFELIEPVKK